MHDVATNLLSETLTKCLAVFETCFQCGISLQMKWIPHSLNDKVDYVSRIIDFYDWQLNPQIFCQLDARTLLISLLHLIMHSCLDIIVGTGILVVRLLMHLVCHGHGS